jgi:hypothetical protein
METPLEDGTPEDVSLDGKLTIGLYVTTCNEDRDVNYKAFLEPLVLGFRIFRP